MSSKKWIMLYIVLIAIIVGLAVQTSNTTYTIEEVDILEIEYLAGSWGNSAKTIIRCQSETYVFSGTLSLPLGRVVIEYTQPMGEIYNLKKWRRLDE